MNLILNANQILTMDDNDIGLKKGTILFDDKIIAIDTENNIQNIIKERYNNLPINIIDASNCIVTPGLIDSHTHTIFDGSRENEFEMRLKGKKYMEILKAGGGILSTVDATRKADSDALLELGRVRLNKMMEYGTTTVEIKSGYGLDKDTEIKILEVIKELDEFHELDIIPTFMGAHAISPGYKSREYLDFLLSDVMPEIIDRRLAIFCDIFCEKGVFEIDDTKYFLERAKSMGFKIKLHADEIESLGGTQLGVSLGAISVDHLGAIDENGILALKNSNTVATLLPGTLFYLMIDKYAPARKLLDNGIDVSLATDFNPGSCFCESLQMIMTLGLLKMKMTPEEVLIAVTKNAAKALDLKDRGILREGFIADIVIWDAPNYKYLAHHFGVNQVKMVLKKGEIVYKNESEV